MKLSLALTLWLTWVYLQKIFDILDFQCLKNFAHHIFVLFYTIGNFFSQLKKQKLRLLQLSIFHTWEKLDC